MKISQTLPQFSGETALLAVTGKQEAEFFVAKDSTIELVSEFRIPKPAYTDREGHFKIRGNGKVYGSGAVYEPNKQWIITEFLKKFEAEVKAVMARRNPTRIELFAPTHMANLLLERTPEAIKQKIFHVVRGNFTRLHPTQLLKKLQNTMYEAGQGGKLYNEAANRILLLPKARSGGPTSS